MAALEMPLKDLAHFCSDESKKKSLVSGEQSKILVVAPNCFGPTRILLTVSISTEEGFVVLRVLFLHMNVEERKKGSKYRISKGRKRRGGANQLSSCKIF